MNLYRVRAGDIPPAITVRPRGHDWLSETDKVFEASRCRGRRFLSVDRSFSRFRWKTVPTSPDEFGKLLDRLNAFLEDGKTVVIHWRAGIGRSSVIAACLLMQNGISREAAFLAIDMAGGIPVPDTADQRKWAEHYCLNRE
jgi:hypothetical protein